jgi:hypothetical protein
MTRNRVWVPVIVVGEARHRRVHRRDLLGVSCTSTGKLHEPLYAPHRQGDALMVLAEVLRLAGRLREAAEGMQQALKLYDQKGNLVLAAKARSRLSELT